MNRLRRPRFSVRRPAKRLFDLAVSIPLAIVLLPVYAVLAMLVLFRLGRPVIFKQVRPGLDARPFTIYKFRSMLEINDADGNRLPDEQRLTRFGQFIRAASLDELPELWNVIRGDMSLVGPRPLPIVYLPRYTAEQARRHDERPGITGLAQVRGRNSLAWEEKFELDLEYVDNHSIGLDLLILMRTIGQVFTQEGISHGDHVTMPEFWGSESPDNHSE